MFALAPELFVLLWQPKRPYNTVWVSRSLDLIASSFLTRASNLEGGVFLVLHDEPLLHLLPVQNVQRVKARQLIGLHARTAGACMSADRGDPSLHTACTAR